MEKLNSDEKMIVLMKLTAKEIVKACAMSKDLSRVCGDPRYNPLWYSKIKQDFNVNYNGSNGYEEYKRLFMLFHTEIYVVSMADRNNDEYQSKVFLTREHFEAYIFEQVNDDEMYAQMATSSIYTNRYEYMEDVYAITKNYIKKRDIESLNDLEDNKKEYAEETKTFYNKLKTLENGEAVIEEFEGLVSDFAHDMSASDISERRDYIDINVYSSIKEFVLDNNLQDYENEIKDYIKYIL